MGSKNSGNRKPKRRAPITDKSQLRSFRFNPKKHQWFLEYLEAFDREQEALPERDRKTRGDWIMEMAQAYEGMEIGNPTLTANAHDIADIRAIVQYIMERIEGGLTVSQGGEKKGKRPKAKPLSDGMRTTIDHYIDNGLSDTSDLDEDE